MWNIHSFFPVRTSNAMTSPLTFSLLGLVPPCVSAGPMTITSLDTTGAELLPILPIGSRGVVRSSSLNRSTAPSFPKSRTGMPVFASSATSWKPGVTVMILAFVPSVQ